MRNPIDVIIPIYNAYDDLKKCVNSILKHMDLTFDRLILIDDHSPDERIIPYLKSLENNNIRCIYNDTNKGFSNNVNMGMLYSDDRDVILLNSDTIVTSNWINKLNRCAYSKQEIGTVTPMSNSATLCSYPITCKDNDIPEHLTIEELGDIIERSSMHIYPRITVAVGFCMYIKREVIQKIGVFDAVTFERGYGEENDFCNRAEQYGYIHVMCDDTFIYHKGTVSFASEEKKQLIDAHDRILNERYPEQMKRNHEYCMRNPDKYIRDNIDIYAKANPKCKNIMYVIHSDFRSDATDNMGGTQFHVRDLVKELKDDYNVYVAARDQEYLRVTMYNQNNEVSLKYYIGKADIFPKEKDSKLYDLFTNLLKAFQINIMHVHHTYGLSFDMIYAAHDLSIPIVLTMHDYYYICPNVKLVEQNAKYCDGFRNVTGCDGCLKKHSGIELGKNFLSNWRMLCRNMFEFCEKIIIPSQAARDVVGLYYPDILDKITVIEHGLEFGNDSIIIDNEDIVILDKCKVNWDQVFDTDDSPYSVLGWACIEGINSNDIVPYLSIECEGKITYYECIKNIRQDVARHLNDEQYIFSGFVCSIFDDNTFGREVQMSVLLKYGNKYYTDGNVISKQVGEKKSFDGFNVAFLGGLVLEKGSTLAKEMIASQTEKINWHIFGTIADKGLLDLKQDNVIKHGTYRQQDLPKLIEQYNIDIICILSIWPETFCYTLSEAICCGIPVFVTDIGALGERVHRHGYGWTVPVTLSGKEMAKKLMNIRDNQQDYMEKKQKAIAFEEITLYNMAQEYKELYCRLKERDKIGDDFDRKMIFHGLIYNNKFKNNDLLYQLLEEKKYILEEKRNILEALTNTQNALDNIQNNKFYQLARKIKHIFVK